MWHNINRMMNNYELQLLAWRRGIDPDLNQTTTTLRPEHKQMLAKTLLFFIPRSKFASPMKKKSEVCDDDKIHYFFLKTFL